MLKINLQRFAEGEDTAPEETIDPNAINAAFGITDDTQLYDEYGDPIPAEPKTEEPPANPPVQEKQEPQQSEPPAQPDKPVQTPEDNARFAEQRRQAQEAQRQQEIERLANERLASSYELQAARALEAMYGMPIDQIAQQLQQAQLQQQAEAQGVPVQYLQQQQAMQQQIEQLQAQANQANFQNWLSTKTAEKAQMLQQFPMLDEADMDQAIEATLSQFRNPELPLQQAVMALHSQKIIDGLQNTARQNALAEVSGREAGPLSPQGTRTTEDAQTLSPEERELARKMGISEKDWLFWRDRQTL